MAVYTHNGTDGPNFFIDFKRPVLATSTFLSYSDEVNVFFINGLGGDDTLSGWDFLTSYIINGGAGNDRLSGDESPDILVGDDLNGVAGNDYLSGSSDNDALFGVGGNDTLIGGVGTDTLYGGTGNDVFKFDSVSDSQPGLLRDVIDDFVGNGILAGDRIDLSTIDANLNIAGNQAFTYIGTRTFSAPGQVRYGGGVLQGNTAGNVTAEFEIQLTGTPLLVASDIIL